MKTIAVTVNDQRREVAADATMDSLARELGLADRKGVAFAVNGDVAPRKGWGKQALRAGDKVIVIQATQGG